MDDLGYPCFSKPPYVVRVGYTYIFSRVTLGVVTMYDVLSTSVKIGIWTNKHRGSSPSAMRTYKAQKCFNDGSKVRAQLRSSFANCKVPFQSIYHLFQRGNLRRWQRLDHAEACWACRVPPWHLLCDLRWNAKPNRALKVMGCTKSFAWWHSATMIGCI